MAKRGRPKKNVLQQKHYEQLLSASDAKHKEEVREVYERAKNYYKGRQWLVQTESSRFDQLIVDNVIIPIF